MQGCDGGGVRLGTFSSAGSSPQNHPPSPVQGFASTAGDPALALGTPAGKGSCLAFALGLHCQGGGLCCCKLRANGALIEALVPLLGAVLPCAAASAPAHAVQESLRSPRSIFGGSFQLNRTPLGLGKERFDQAKAVLSCGLLSRRPHLVVYFVMN